MTPMLINEENEMSALSEMPVVTVEQVHRFREAALSEVKRLQGVMNQAILLVNPNRIEEATADDLLLQLGMMLDEMEELRKAPEVIDRLITERNELKAHLTIAKQHVAHYFTKGLSQDAREAQLHAVMKKTTSQSLAEIQAQAIENASDNCEVENGCCPQNICSGDLYDYAEQLRNK